VAGVPDSFIADLFESFAWTQSFFASGLMLPALFSSGSLVVVVVSVFPLSYPYSAVMPNVCAILWNSLSHISKSSKLPFTVMILLGPDILSTR
jgi:hypothetical protein